MKTEILALLRETDGYVSGQELCEKFGVSRTAVWKAINQLKEAGYEIEAVQNKGYHLVSVPDILSESELQSVRKTKVDLVQKNCVFLCGGFHKHQSKATGRRGRAEWNLCHCGAAGRRKRTQGQRL